jgi:cysteinyl-tRNA synthetase
MDQLVYDLKYHFTESMDDDLNIAPALAALFRFTGRINKIMDTGGLAQGDKNKVQDCLAGINSVLGVMDLEPPELDQIAETLLREREKARKAKDWETADRIRRDLEEQKGIQVIDTKDGPTWRKKGGGG